MQIINYENRRNINENTIHLHDALLLIDVISGLEEQYADIQSHWRDVQYAMQRLNSYDLPILLSVMDSKLIRYKKFIGILKQNIIRASIQDGLTK